MRQTLHFRQNPNNLRRLTQVQALSRAIIGRPLCTNEIVLDDELMDYMDEKEVTFRPEQPSLVHLRRHPARQVIRQHGYNVKWMEEAIATAAESVTSPLIASRQQLDMELLASTEASRTFLISTMPLRAYTSDTLTQVNLRDEQYAISCTLGDNFADTPQIWLGTLEGPARNDNLEEVMDMMEDRFPTMMSLGRAGIILANQAA